MAGKKGPRINDIHDISIFLAKLIRETYRGEIDDRKAGKLACMLNILKGCLEASELERRIEELEAQLKGVM